MAGEVAGENVEQAENRPESVTMMKTFFTTVPVGFGAASHFTLKPVHTSCHV
jgi:hypothetical protein